MEEKVLNKQKRCPMCGSGAFTGKIFPAYAHLADSSGLGQFLECNECSTLVSEFRGSLDALYASRNSQNYAERELGIIKSLKASFLKYSLTRIVASTAQDGMFLDYGCGGGELANFLYNQGFKVVAADLQPERPSSLCPDIIYCELSKLDSLDFSFEAVFIRHVLEHVDSPEILIDTCLQVLEPQGIIYIETPNADSVYRKIFGSYWPGYYYPYHVFVPTMRGFASLLANMNICTYETHHANPAFLGTVFVSLGLNRTAARLLSASLYPVQLFISKFTGSNDAIGLIIKKK